MSDSISWVDSAQDVALGRPLGALPYCVFSVGSGRPRPGVGIGDQVVDLAEAARADLLRDESQGVQEACAASTLNALLTIGVAAHCSLRRRVMEILGDVTWRDRVLPVLQPVSGLQFHRPVNVPDYADFYGSIEHAETVGRLFRPEQPLLANYRHLPIGYHGRASSIVVSGTPIVRPSGQVRSSGSQAPRFLPSAQLDYEMEIAAYLYGGDGKGVPVAIDEAADQIFGLSLLNDWSARDIQAWEYQPLGPFLGKSFATSVSPWVVPVEALAAFRVPARRRSDADPQLLPYLQAAPDAHWSYELVLEAWLRTEEMRRRGGEPVLLGRSSLDALYWTLPQMIAHYTSNGCSLAAGDLLATGTISGAQPGEQGCLLEMTQRGASPIALPTGEARAFLEDNDEVILRGYCERDGVPRVSLGECRGTVLPAR